jgi:hypothetical protein
MPRLSGCGPSAGAWIWVDSCSKDQLVGQVFGLVAPYDAMLDDPDIDQSLVERMRTDARQLGQMLMEERELAQPGCIRRPAERRS